ncbi:MAG: hypothetical protein HON76_13985 [Candidatus Scalindua sp.]|jgi:hypothetical protein|nr:hypothetical protein [Candidatus Scalindua sp.]MBT5304172.1 hypothetical protein [Candidatus Scalindua sp.]MBT6053026.1 hypothetical protein [Candidatus Scalindua sp.]MBT6229152.1 hypothetical protein [Candidatus Scalindua sp.]MBT6563628.1 hypothetical protein [Candidatus Scalindua sp.]
MWKRKKKQKIAKASEETPSSKEEAVDAVTEESPSSEGEETVSAVAEEAPSTEEEKAVSTTEEEVLPAKEDEKVGVGTGEALPVEEAPSSGVFIFGSRIESRFKKFLTVLFSIFLLPPVIVFGLSVITIVVLIAFPLISIVLPITLLSLCILFILLPVVLPLFTIIALITGRGKVQFGLENKKFAIKVLGITIPPYAGR